MTPSELTRLRLVGAAREVFAERGFQKATVREICRRAEANVAAVNYHFGSKEELFAEALNFTGLRELQKPVAGCSPENRLRRFVSDFMMLLLDENNASSQMMMRELADPSSVLDKIVTEAIAPLHLFVGQLVEDIVGEKMNGKARLLIVYSLLGQCLFYRNSHPVLQRIYPELRYDMQEIELISQHIADFTLAALAQAKDT